MQRRNGNTVVDSEYYAILGGHTPIARGAQANGLVEYDLTIRVADAVAHTDPRAIRLSTDRVAIDRMRSLYLATQETKRLAMGYPRRISAAVEIHFDMPPYCHQNRVLAIHQPGSALGILLASELAIGVSTAVEIPQTKRYVGPDSKYSQHKRLHFVRNAGCPACVLEVAPLNVPEVAEEILRQHDGWRQGLLDWNPRADTHYPAFDGFITSVARGIKNGMAQYMVALNAQAGVTK